MKKQVVFNIKQMEANCDDVARILKAIAHPQRLMLLCHLSNGEKTVGELEDLCSISQSAVSQFLNRMKFEGLLESEKRGLYVYYSIKNSKIKVLVTSLHHVFCS